MKQIKKIFKWVKQLFYFLFWRQRRFRQRLFLRIKIKKLIQKTPVLKGRKKRDNDYLNRSKKFLQKYFPGYKNTNWHFAYSSINGIKSVEYIPEELYFSFVEPALNNLPLKNAYTDKNAYNNFVEKEYLPSTVFKIINGEFFTEDFHLISGNDARQKIAFMDEKLVLKPAIFSGGGKNVVVQNSKHILEKLNSDNQYKTGSFILQKYVEQHDVLKQFNPGSLNTLRVLTARVMGEIVLLSWYLRTGRNNSVVDNGVAGGVACGIDQTGKLKNKAYDMHLNEFEKHPSSGVVFSGVEIPGSEAVRDFCLSHHRKLPHFTFVSWDIGIRSNGLPVFIEFNLCMQEVGTHQLINGPLFGQYTSYFLEKYTQQKSYRHLNQI